MFKDAQKLKIECSEDLFFWKFHVFLRGFQVLVFVFSFLLMNKI